MNRRIGFAVFWLSASLAIVGCIGVPAKRYLPDGSEAPPKYCARGIDYPAEGLIDDMEDGNNRIDATEGRGGYWWKSADPLGSTIGPEDSQPEPSPDGNGLAMHAYGETVAVGGDDNWGAQFGADFSSVPGYDASKYAGIRFRAKMGPDSSPNVRFKIADVNTHPKMGVCTECWNHFGRDVNLSQRWQTFEFMFSALEQAPYWGNPRPGSITPSKLYALVFEITPGKKFDIWIDDIAFITCK